LFETLRRMLSAWVADLIASTQARIAAAAPASADEARRAGPLVALSAPLQAELTALQRFLFGALYRHPQVMHTTTLARRALAELFAAYSSQPAEMPAEHAASAGQVGLPRAVADYIAGMTDRFALREHQRLTGQRLFAAD
jgi:dGTPase